MISVTINDFIKACVYVNIRYFHCLAYFPMDTFIADCHIKCPIYIVINDGAPEHLLPPPPVNVLAPHHLRQYK